MQGPTEMQMNRPQQMMQNMQHTIQGQPQQILANQGQMQQMSQQPSQLQHQPQMQHQQQNMPSQMMQQQASLQQLQAQRFKSQQIPLTTQQLQHIQQQMQQQVQHAAAMGKALAVGTQLVSKDGTVIGLVNPNNTVTVKILSAATAQYVTLYAVFLIYLIHTNY